MTDDMKAALSPSQHDADVTAVATEVIPIAVAVPVAVPVAVSVPVAVAVAVSPPYPYNVVAVMDIQLEQRQEVAKQFHDFVTKQSSPRFKLLRDKEVICFLLEDESFLFQKGQRRLAPPERQKLENVWGKAKLALHYPDWKKASSKGTNWAGELGERVVEELLYLQGYEVVTRQPVASYKVTASVDLSPDDEKWYGMFYTRVGEDRIVKADLLVHDAVIEVKSGTLETSGTAYQKVVAVPTVYATAQRIFEKPKLLIVLVGDAARKYREYFMSSEEHRARRKEEEKKGFYYIYATDMMRECLKH
jgi:hypothetical protein